MAKALRKITRHSTQLLDIAIVALIFTVLT